MKLNKNNEIIVNIPFFVKEESVNQFIEKHINKFIDIIEKRELIKPINTEENYFYLFGKKQTYLIDTKKNKMIVNNKILSIKDNNLTKTIYNYIKKELNVYIIIQQNKFEKIMNIENHKIAIRQKENAWGTNYVKDKKIFYSYKLGHFDKSIIDYVIVHELSHNKFANHSKEFWNYVEKYEPNFKSKKLKLKKYIYS